MADLLGLSARIIDEGADENVNRITLELSEIDDRIAMVEAFSHVVALATDDGLVLFDTSLEQLGKPALTALRGWSDDRIDTIVYTHGHVDHVGGARVVVSQASERGEAPPAVIAHEAVPDRFARYDLTNGYNAVINQRQFGRSGIMAARDDDRPVFPSNWVHPTVTFREELQVAVGGIDLELHHGLGETDDHTWAWLPSRRAAFVGDFFIWAFPNAGNPQKVQRYPLEWAESLRAIAARQPQLLLPAHGLPVAGEERIQRVLDDTARALESLVEQTLALMNEGASLDTIVHSVKAPPDLLDRPYLRPVYDDPEFIVRNVWRGYGGWYDGNPAHLKPAPDQVVASELAALAGGVPVLTDRALAVADEGDLRLAAHLVELAVQADPGDPGAHAARAEIYRRRRKHETSLMAKGIFGYAERQSAAMAGPGEADTA
jgi:alkyl sulfatase BDS1-like metallo-beta-lactamase superfamily hydrolase